MKRLGVLAAAALLAYGWVVATPPLVEAIRRPVDFVRGPVRVLYDASPILVFSGKVDPCDSVRILGLGRRDSVHVAVTATPAGPAASDDTLRTAWSAVGETGWWSGCFPTEPGRWLYSLAVADADGDRPLLLGHKEAPYGPTTPFRVDVVAVSDRWIYSTAQWGGVVAVFLLALVLYAGGGAFERGIADPGTWTRAQSIRVAAALWSFVFLVWLILPLRMMAIGGAGFDLLNDPRQLIALPIGVFWLLCRRWGHRLTDQRRFTQRHRARFRVVTRIGAGWSILAVGAIVWN